MPLRARDLRRLRATAQRLGRERAGGPVAVVGDLLAVQAQDLRAARLALRARGDGFTAADVDAALTRERSLVIAWLNRGTLHLVRREDHGWLLALTAPRWLRATQRRLAQEGVAPDAADRAVAVVERALAAEGPLPRSALADRLSAAGIRTAGQATPHLLALAAARGVAVLGPVDGGRPAFAHVRDWLGPPPAPPERERALGELARRYLAAHGPATAADLAAWAGVALRDARAGLAANARRLADHGGGLVDLAAREPALPVPARLLPAFDPYMLGWRDRAFAVAPDHARLVHPGGGVVRAVAVEDGRVAGTWGLRGAAVEAEAFDGRARDLWDAEAADVRRFLYPAGTG